MLCNIKFWNVYLLAVQTAITFHTFIIRQTTLTDFGTFALEIYITHLYLLQFSQINILFYIHSFLIVSNHFMSNVMTKGLHYSTNKMIAQR